MRRTGPILCVLVGQDQPKEPTMPNTPTATYRDGLTIGQLARQWERDASFVRGLIDSGKLATDERGCITVQSLRDFYRTSPHPLDG